MTSFTAAFPTLKSGSIGGRLCPIKSCALKTLAQKGKLRTTIKYNKIKSSVSELIAVIIVIVQA